MAKVERRIYKGKGDSQYEAVSDSKRLVPVASNINRILGHSIHAVMMQCLLFLLFLSLCIPNLSFAVGAPSTVLLPSLSIHKMLPACVAVSGD